MTRGGTESVEGRRALSAKERRARRRKGLRPGHAPRRGALSARPEGVGSIRLQPVSEWMIQSNREPEFHSAPFASLLEAEVTTDLDRLAADGVREAMARGEQGVSQEHEGDAPILPGQPGYPSRWARVAFVAITEGGKGSGAICSVGLGLREEGREPELATLARRFEIVREGE